VSAITVCWVKVACLAHTPTKFIIGIAVMSASPAAEAPKAQPQRLTLEEKLWFDRRKNDLQQCGGFGAAVGAATGAALTCAFIDWFIRSFAFHLLVNAVGGGILTRSHSGTDAVCWLLV
jgi:hypothetical protein